MDTTPTPCPVCGCLIDPTRLGSACPRCGLALDRPRIDPFDALATDRSPSPQASLAHRIAGGVLLANSLLLIVYWLIQTNKGAEVPILNSPFAAILDLGIGITLLAGSQALRGFAIFRLSVGMIVLPAIFLAQTGVFAAVFQVVFLAAVLALLVGRAGTPRIAVASSVIGMVMLVQMGTLANTVSGVSPIALYGLTAASDPITTSRVHGTRLPWTLAVPPGWRQLKPEAASKLSPIADAWFVLPTSDAHIQVVAESIPKGRALDLDRFRGAVLDNLKRALPDMTIVEERELETRGDFDHALLLHVQGTGKGMQLGYAIGIFTRRNEGYQVHAWCHRERFAKLAPDFVRAIESFEVEKSE